MAGVNYRQRLTAYATAIFKLKALAYFDKIRKDERLWK